MFTGIYEVSSKHFEDVAVFTILQNRLVPFKVFSLWGTTFISAGIPLLKAPLSLSKLSVTYLWIAWKEKKPSKDHRMWVERPHRRIQEVWLEGGWPWHETSVGQKSQQRGLKCLGDELAEATRPPVVPRSYAGQGAPFVRTEGVFCLCCVHWEWWQQLQDGYFRCILVQG